MKERIYVLLGGTGPIGIHLIKALEKTPNTRVFVTSRKRHESTDKVTYLRGNAKDLDFLRKTIFDLKEKCGSIDVVVDFMVWSNEDFGTVISLLLPNTNKYVYLSSSRTFADTKGNLIKEDSPKWLDVATDKKFLRTDGYAIPKAQQEKMLQSSGFDNFLIIRPYITYAENRLPLGSLEKEIWLYRVLHGRTLVFSENVAKHYTSLMYGKDVADSMCNLIINDSVPRDTVNVTFSESLKWREVLTIYSNVLKRHYPKVKIKMIPNSIKAGGGDYQTIYDRMVDRRFDSSKLAHYVDETAFTHMKEGLEKCLEANIKHFNYNTSLQDWRLQALLDRTTHEYASYNEFPKFKTFLKYIVYRSTPKLVVNIYRIIKSKIK